MSHTRSKGSNVVGTMCKQSGCRNLADKSGMCDECANKQATEQATEIVNAYNAYQKELKETHPGNKMLPLPKGGYEFKSKRSNKRSNKRSKRSNKRSKRSNKRSNKRKSVRKNKKSLRK